MRTSGNGQHVPIDPDRRVWLERLLRACDSVHANVPDPSDPHLRTLLEDVAILRSRLLAELGADEEQP